MLEFRYDTQLLIDGDDLDEDEVLEFRYDTQLLIDGDDLDEDEVFDYIVEHFKGDSLLAVGGDGDPIKSPGSFWNTELLSARSMTSS